MTMDSKTALERIIHGTKEASKSFFVDMCEFPLTNEKIITDTNIVAAEDQYGIVGVIAVTGDCRGSCSVHFPSELAVKMAQKLLGMDEIDDKSLIFDCVGEASNIITGNVKTTAASASPILNFDISCPTVIRGNPYAILEPVKGSIVGQIQYEVEGFPFLNMISIIDK